MSVVRVLVDAIPLPGEKLVLSSEEAHHLRVRRVVPGEEVLILDGRGREARGRLMVSGVLKIQEVDLVLEREHSVRLTLYVAVLKGDKMALVIQKATELGVAEIVPLLTRRSLPRPPSSRIDRWNTIAKEALKQCGGTVLPRIYFPQPLEIVEGPGWVLWEGERERELPRGIPGPLGALVVGPEGGWEDEEIDLLKERGFLPVTLGLRVLRAETAAVVGTALLLWG